MSKIKIAFGVTKDWLNYTYVTMCSILSNANTFDSYFFYIMCDIQEDEFEQSFCSAKDKLNSIHKFEYQYIKMNNSDFDGVIHDTRVGISASYRLKLASLTNEDKIIYLDSDVVVLDNLSKLWNYNIEDYLLGAVEDKYSDMMKCHANLDYNDIYINSGVLLMNLKKFRKINLEETIFEKLREYNTYSDQDVLNDVCRKQILYLPLKFNLMVIRDDPNSFPKRRDEFTEALKSPVIMHYVIKPWFLPVQYSEYWFKYANILK